MRNKIAEEIKNKYFDPNLELRIQFFHLLAFIGIAAGFTVAVIAIIIKEQVLTILADLMISVLSFLLLIIAEKKKCYHLCNWIMIVAAFMIIFPALFVICGGYRCGVSCFFVLAITFTAHMLEKRERIAAIAIEFVLYILCCMITYYVPEMTNEVMPNNVYIVDVTLNFIIASIVLLFTVMLRNRMINVKHEQIRELNRELIARNETLAQYDRMKSDFLATVAHEINTPLAVIAASSSDTLDLLNESPLNMDEIIENQSIIERRVRLIDNIILDLMDTVAIENGRFSLNRQPVNLSVILKNICETQFGKLDINENLIEYDFQPDLPRIWADPARIEQVMINLLSNAVRYTKGGTILIKLKRVNGGQIVSVTDNGEGMDGEMARVVLKQYVSTKADYWRHGIGLYICRRIITAHGGDIWIKSEKGRGTTVSFSLREESDYERA